MATKRRKKEAFSRWDAADYLKSDDDMAAYLQACLEEAPDDPALIAAALGDIARARGMVQLAMTPRLPHQIDDFRFGEVLFRRAVRLGGPMAVPPRSAQHVWEVDVAGSPWRPDH